MLQWKKQESTQSVVALQAADYFPQLPAPADLSKKFLSYSWNFFVVHKTEIAPICFPMSEGQMLQPQKEMVENLLQAPHVSQQ